MRSGVVWSGPAAAALQEYLNRLEHAAGEVVERRCAALKANGIPYKVGA